MGNGSSPLLIVGPVGSPQAECAIDIHRRAGGGNFERIICSSDSVELRTQVFGPITDGFAESILLGAELPIGAIQRATGGTLFFEYIDRCSSEDADWIRLLLTRQLVTVGRRTFELEPSTRVIASITNGWGERNEYLAPSWLMTLFDDRVVVLEPLGSRLQYISSAIDWLHWQATQEMQATKLPLSAEAQELLLSLQWPGDYRELHGVIRSLVFAANDGDTITHDVCKRVIASHEGPGMRSIDNYWRQECSNYCRGLLYMGRPISPNDIYHWVGQLARLSTGRKFDPWSTGLRIVREISRKYYYSSDRIRILIREAYSSLCVELTEKSYMPNRPTVGSNTSLPSLHAVLINPLGPVKSAAGVLPHMAHLLGSGVRQKVVRMEDVAAHLAEDNEVQVILFCDDFTGTGRQIATQGN